MSILAAALAGGVIGLDATTFPQVMLSRPIVAGALAGWLAGIPVEGAIVGAILEAFHLAILPVGAAKYPESGTATVAAVFALAWSGQVENGVGMLLALTFALGWERLAGGSVNLMRKVNGRIAPAGDAPLSPGAIELRHGAAMALDFGRGSLVTVTGLAACALWLDVVGAAWVHGPELARGLIIAAAAGSAAAALRVFGGWNARWKLFVAGIVAGTIVVLL